MGISVFPESSTPAIGYPLNTSSLVFAGYSSKGAYSYATNLSSGNYILYTVASDSTARTIVNAPNSNSNFIGNSQYSQINLSTTENPVKIWTVGAYESVGPIVDAGGSERQPGSGRTGIGWNNGNLWFSSNNLVLYSTNYGSTWSSASPGASNPYGTPSTFYDGTAYWIGYYNAAYYSTNITTWTTRAITGMGYVYGIGYRAAATSPWVAVGDIVASSTNGTTWTQRIATGNWRDVIAGGGYHVAVGAWNATGSWIGFAYSTDGQTWTTGTTLNNIFGTSTSSNAAQIVYGNNRWLVAGYNFNNSGVGTPRVAWSTNVTTWNLGLSLATTSAIQGLAYGNGIFSITVSDSTTNLHAIYYTTNGASWTSSPAPGGVTPMQVMIDTGSSNTPKVLTRQSASPYNIWRNVDTPAQIYMYAISGQSVLN